MSGTITTTLTASYTLTSNPTTIDQTGGIVTAGDAVTGPAGTAWLLDNQGTIQSTTDTGINLADGGTIINGSPSNAAAFIGGYSPVFIAGNSGSVANYGTIVSNEKDGNIGVVMSSGGNVYNASTGDIQARAAGVYITGGAASIVNAGNLYSPGNAVLLAAGGTIDNLSGGEIEGATAVMLASATAGQSVSIDNAGIIDATTYGAITQKGSYATALTITNAGQIDASSTNDAIGFAAGVTNRLIVDGGGTFRGIVDGGNTLGAAFASTLELASATGPGTLSGLGTQFINFATTAVDAGASWTATGANILAGTLINDGDLIVGDAGTLSITGALVTDSGNNGTLGIGANATLSLAGTLNTTESLMFDGTDGTAIFGTPGAVDGTIGGFTFGDTLLLSGFTTSTYEYVAGAGLEVSNGTVTHTLDITGSFSTGSFEVTDTPEGTEVVLCYMRGTRIATPAGEVAVEALQAGDAVMTRFGGYRRIKWIGRQSYGARFIRGNRDRLPVRIAAGALGAGLPKCDLFVSPGHSMLLGDVLVLARDLVNGITITQNGSSEDVHYYQLEFETHDCVLAEGVWSESFCDHADLRGQFHNAAEFWTLYPEHVTPAEHLMCAPRPEAGYTLAAALYPAVARAAALAPLGQLRGVLDEVSPDGLIRGWAQDMANPELPVLLAIALGTRLLGTTLACDHRPDLAAAGIGTGRAAFSFQAPRLSPEEQAAIVVRRVADGAVLAAGTKWCRDRAA